jgi:lipopolysaccharide transport system ATP-binding protein
VPCSDIAISVRGLGKSYTIAHNVEQHSTLAETMLSRIRRPFQRPQRETFWALNDVSFDIKKGDVVGVIGRNGAGKSTLLKILSRITEPTRGEIDLYGRVGSLLEVGTGFHPELSGRENIYLNGAILGMTRAEIRKQFDAIVDFAGVEKFLDTPVKRYSSGMYVRLAFAVAAHLQTEILMVDEVLAVGDAEFQKKCLGKIKDVARCGRTVLFVSHNIASINSLCSSCLVLKSGELAFAGGTLAGTRLYMDEASHWARSGKKDLRTCRPSWAQPLITSVRILDADDQEQDRFAAGTDLTIAMGFNAPSTAPLQQPVMGVVIHRAGFGTLGGVNMRMTGVEIPDGPYTAGILRCTIPRFPFLPGQYTLDLWLGDGPGDNDAVYGCVSFEIENADVYGTGRTPFADMGVAFFDPQWQLIPSDTFALK